MAPRANGGFALLLLRDWKRILAITVITAALAWLFAAAQPSRYRASTLVSVGPRTEALQPNELLRSVEVLERRTVVATVAALASTSVTRARAAAGTGDDIEATILPNTNLFRIDVESGDAARATMVANRLPALLDAQTAAMYKYYVVTVVSPAGRAENPERPRTARAAIAGALLGLFLGVLTSALLMLRGPR